MNPMNEGKPRKPSHELHSSDQPPHVYHRNLVTPPASYQWHEVDYTAPIVDVNPGSRFAPTSAPLQYAGGATMQFAAVDYSQQGYAFAAAYNDPENGSSYAQASAMYQVGPFRYTDIDTASLSQESMYSRGTRLHSLTDSERRDSQPNSIMTGTDSRRDSRRESESLMRDFSMINGDHKISQSGSHRPSAPSLDLRGLSSIEECESTHSIANLSPYISTTHSASPFAGNDRDSEDRTISPNLQSPTTLQARESSTPESSKNLKGRKNPRARTARSASSDDLDFEKVSKLRARQAHSLVERKYRDNLNLKISQLHQTLQNARYGPNMATSQSPLKESKLDSFDTEIGMGLNSPTQSKPGTGSATGPKARKSDVLSDAMNYVNATEVEMRHMSEEIIRLTDRVQMLEKLIRCEDCNLMKQMVSLQVQGAGQHELHQHLHTHQCQ